LTLTVMNVTDLLSPLPCLKGRGDPIAQTDN